MTVTLILGLVLNAIALPLAGKRAVFLYRLITTGQPAPDRIENVTKRTVEAHSPASSPRSSGRRSCSSGRCPGTAHAFVMYAFLILATVYFEAYAVLLSRDPEWHWFVFGSWSVLGFAQDLISVLCLVGLASSPGSGCRTPRSSWAASPGSRARTSPAPGSRCS